MIDVGGGFRAIYGAGVMDRMLEDGISVDHCYGVSAGSANIVSFIAKQHGRNHTFYTQYAFRKEYASFDSYVKNHNFANLDYVYSTLSNHDGENPVDYAAFEANPTDFTVVACNAEDGSTKYFSKSDVSYDNFDIMKASSAVPVACEPYAIDGVPYYDGGIADPIPVQKAIDDGYNRIVVILTRPKRHRTRTEEGHRPGQVFEAQPPRSRGKTAQPLSDVQRRSGAGQGIRAGRPRAHPRAGKPVRPEHVEQFVRRFGTHVPRGLCGSRGHSLIPGKLSVNLMNTPADSNMHENANTNPDVGITANAAGFSAKTLNPQILVTLWNVERLGSFSAVARETGWSQPAISQQIRKVERELDAKLVQRTSHGVELTPIGGNLARHGQLIYNRVTQAVKDVEEYQRNGSTHIRLVAPIGMLVVRGARARAYQQNIRHSRKPHADGTPRSHGGVGTGSR